jgi:Domain of unknown function (DUF4397)
MLRRRLAAAVALADLRADLFAKPGAASGTQAADQALVRVAHFAPGLLGGDVYVNGRLQLKGVPFKTVSDYLKVAPGKFKVEVRKAGSGEVLAKSDNLKLASGSISSLVAVGGIGERLELLDITDAAAAVSAAGFIVQQRRSTG